MVDKQLVFAIGQLPKCSESITLAVDTTVAARKASSMASTLYQAQRVDLSGARILRAEALMGALLDILSTFDRDVASLRRTVNAVASTKPKRLPSWNSLGDKWYIERAQQLNDKLHNMEAARRGLQVALDVVLHGDGGVDETYAHLVRHVNDAAILLSNAWRAVLLFVEEWKDVAVVVAQGLGESASLIPAR